jgi:AraC-like DNA-binding protein
MISVDRLLDGLDVEVQPLIVHETGPNAPTLRYSKSGCGLVELVGGATLRCSRDRVVVLPPAWRARAAAGDDGVAVEDVRAGGRIRATFQGSLGLFDHLRAPLIENLAAGDPIRRSFEDIRDEVAAGGAGCRAMVEALLRRALVLLLRRHFAHGDGRESWLAALEDARLGRALAAMQSRPEEPFSLSRLAEVAGMSRSVFAARFSDTLGQSPIEFLKTLRLARAAHLLGCTDLPVKTVAARVGYSSRSSFTRAFLTCHGVGPAAFRSRAATPASAAEVA